LRNRIDFEGFCRLGYNAVKFVESQQTFRRKMSPPSSELKNKPRNQREIMWKTCFHAGFLAYSSILKMEATCSPEMSVDFSGLHGVISQEIVFFITTAV
jgi:hypothetical protein